MKNKKLKIMRKILSSLLVLLALGCGAQKENKEFSNKILNNKKFGQVKNKALEVVEKGFNAGDGYGEVWIRDFNSFIGLATEVHDKEIIKKNLRVFFKLQGEDGNIVDGFIPKANAVKTKEWYSYISTDLEKQYVGHKNTVETDQETSLVQAVYTYIKKTNDTEFLKEKIGGTEIGTRLENSMGFLMDERYDQKYGLLWGATTADWGDVQPEHDWGVYLTDETHYAIDVYDNAMFIIALDNLMELLPGTEKKWRSIRNDISKNTMKYLWDNDNKKFRPHVYLNGSPFPDSFDEDEIYYHGGTAIAIQAGLLSKQQILISLQKMKENVEKSGASSIGLTLYPPYPAGMFLNKGMYPYGYQNGGDWTWFGGRMIKTLINHGFEEQAYNQLQPMLDRVIKNDGFYEWYTVGNEPKGSATFKASAGVLFDVIELLQRNKNKEKYRK